MFAEQTGTRFPISQPALAAWQNAVAAHQSQISSFWGDLDEMRGALETYSQWMEGVKLLE